LVKAGCDFAQGSRGMEETLMKKTTLYIRLFREVVITSYVTIKLVKLVHDFVIPALNYLRVNHEKLFVQDPIRQQ